MKDDVNASADAAAQVALPGGATPRQAVLAELVRMLVGDLKLGLDEAHIDAEAPLLEGGLGLDSITLFELITLIEKRYGVSFPADSMSSETFSNLNAVVQLIMELRDGQGSAA